MLADQDVELIERNLGQGWNIRNLIYIHRQCGETVIYSNEDTGEHIDLFSLLDGIMDDAPAEESPYMELTEFFGGARSRSSTSTLSRSRPFWGTVYHGRHIALMLFGMTIPRR